MAARVLDELFATPRFLGARFRVAAGASHPAASKRIEFWPRAGFVPNATGQRHDPLFVADRVMKPDGAGRLEEVYRRGERPRSKEVKR